MTPDCLCTSPACGPSASWQRRETHPRTRGSSWPRITGQLGGWATVHLPVCPCWTLSRVGGHWRTLRPDGCEWPRVTFRMPRHQDGAFVPKIPQKGPYIQVPLGTEALQTQGWLAPPAWSCDQCSSMLTCLWIILTRSTFSRGSDSGCLGSRLRLCVSQQSSG